MHRIGWIWLLWFGFTLSNAFSADRFWVGENGSYTDPANWSASAGGAGGDSAPGGSDTAIFRRGETIAYTVTLPGAGSSNPPVNHLVDRLRVGSNLVELVGPSPELGSATYTVANASTTEIGRGVIVGQLATDDATLVTRLPVSAVAATLGEASGSKGTLNVDAGLFHITGAHGLASMLDLIVGNHGAGTLNIRNGADVMVSGIQSLSILGNRLGSSGAATVLGAGSSWSNSGSLNVGREGEGNLLVAQGGSLSSASGVIGSLATSTGSVTVSGEGSHWSNTGPLWVGNVGVGSLAIEAGASVANSTGEIGLEAGSNGTVNVTGNGSVWMSSGSITIGNSGSGTLTLGSGGDATSAGGFIGRLADSNGTAIVTGFGSTWTNSGAMEVGSGGTGTLLVTDGGRVSNTSASIGHLTGSGSVLVSGGGSSWVNSGTLNVGRSGFGILTIIGGGSVSNASASIGQFAGANGSVSVDGPGSIWTISGSLDIGGVFGVGSGGSGALNIDPGGSVHVSQDVNLFPGGLLQLQDGTLAAGTIRFLEGGGNFEWSSGTLHVETYMGDLFNAAGTLAPGLPIGQTAIQGGYIQTPDGTLEIEIAGPTPEYDAVQIAGSALLGGTLELALFEGFLPAPTQTFTILSAGNLSGSFSNVASGQRLAVSGGLGSFLVHYGAGSPFSPNQVVLSNFLATGLPGDYNQDGSVDAADYVLWRKNDGSPAGYTTWRANFGSRLSGHGAAAVGSGTNAAPEPTSVMLAFIGAIAMLQYQARCGRWSRGYISRSAQCVLHAAPGRRDTAVVASNNGVRQITSASTMLEIARA